MRTETMVLAFYLTMLPVGLWAAGQPQAAVDVLSVQNEPATEVVSQAMVLVNEVRTNLKADASLRPALSDIQLMAESNGVMHVKGTVASRDEKKLIEDKVRATVGVTEVQSEIQVI